jgi:DNA polymerase-1
MQEGRRIRQAFIAPRGYKIVTVDYSQIELRIMAHLSQDENLCRAFADGHDIHRSTAAEIFGVTLDHVTNEQRQRAKTINFGLIYGMSTFGLAKRLGLSRATAQAFVDRYFARYPGVKKYMEDACTKGREHGFVTTIYGRRIYLPNIKAKNFQLKNAAERAAINAPMQGSAADIIKIAMINVDQWLMHAKLDVKMIMQVHDELVFEIATADVTVAVPKITALMENAAKLSVPIIAHSGVGDNWDEAHA